MKGRRIHHCAVWLLQVAALLAAVSAARAQDATDQATSDQTHRAQLERLRAEIANQIQLQACDLIDELVFGWLESPPFANRTPVVVADVVAPVGYGSGLEALIENHLAQLLVQNPDTNVQLAHCPACNAVVVHSDATGTVIARGVDQPDALERLRGRSGAEHALFLDFEAEGTALVLRARMTALVHALPIVYAKTLSTQTSSAPMLRSSSHLVSADQARREYLAILEQRGPIKVPVRLALGVFAPSEDAMLEVPVPIPWLQVGAELAITSARAWTGSLTAGITFIPDVMAGAMLQARVSRLLTGAAYSLTYPNLYGFGGLAMSVIQGPTAGLLAPSDNPSLTDQMGPIVIYPSLQAGLEVRISDRIGAAVFAETMPTLMNAPNVGSYLDLMGIQIHNLGAEATFAF